MVVSNTGPLVALETTGLTRLLPELFGKISVSSLALQQRSNLVIIDERKGRRVAEQIYGLSVLGTLGILARAKSAGLIRSLRAHLSQLQDSGYYLSDQLIEKVCRSCGEE